MKIQIVKRTYKDKTGYYIRYKNFLFWHSVYYDKGPKGEVYYTDSFGEDLDFKRYFKTYEDALEYAKKNLGDVSDSVVKEFEA